MADNHLILHFRVLSPHKVVEGSAGQHILLCRLLLLVEELNVLGKQTKSILNPILGPGAAMVVIHPLIMIHIVVHRR